MRRLRSDAGQAAAEFIMLFPLMMLLVLFFIEFGLALHSWVLVNNAAAEAARYAAVGNVNSPSPTCAANSIQARAMQASGNNILCNEVTVTYRFTAGGTRPVQRGDEVVVRIDHTYETVTGLVGLLNYMTGGLVDTEWTMSSCADARLETGGSVAITSTNVNCGS
jgi:Flp pilus assembly protein TadG